MARIGKIAGLTRSILPDVGPGLMIPWCTRESCLADPGQPVGTHACIIVLTV